MTRTQPGDFQERRRGIGLMRTPAVLHWDVRIRVRMELFAKIRRDARVEDLSIRGLAKRYQSGREVMAYYNFCLNRAV
jgi:hypothetical protein